MALKKIFFSGFAFLLVHASLSGHDPELWSYTSAKEELAFCPTESLLSAVVGQVSVISGELVMGQKDLSLVGPEPLTLERSFVSNPNIYNRGYKPPPLKPAHTHFFGPAYRYWQFSQFNGLYFQVHAPNPIPLPGVSYKKAKLRAVVPHPSGGLMMHKTTSSDRSYGKHSRVYEMPLHQKAGFTNCGAGGISAKTNPKNVVALMNIAKVTCDVVNGRHCKHYEGRWDPDSPEEWIFVNLWPEYERKANGNQIKYSGDTTKAKNKKGKIFSWFKFNWVSEQELHIENSHMAPLIYRYKPHDYVNSHANDLSRTFLLSSVEFPNAPKEKYKYARDTLTEEWLLKSKKLPQGRYTTYEYMAEGDIPGELLKIPIQKEFDARLKRVKSIQAPVGTDATPITTHRFFYDFSGKIDNVKKKSEVGEGRTTVYDALNHKSVYHYNDKQRLTKKVKYAQKKEAHITEYLWVESLKKKPKKIDLEGNLLGKIIRNAKEIHTARYFDYDEKGNILCDKLYGNLTGKGMPFILDENRYPIDPQEVYQKTFTYSKDGLNLLSESEPNGKTIHYSYYPDSDLLKSKLTLSAGTPVIREFYEYDENNALSVHIRDDGNHPDKNNLNGVSERHIKRFKNRTQIPVGLPEVIEESYWDGTEKPLKTMHCSYSSTGLLTCEDVFDSQKVHRYTRNWEYDAHGNLTRETNALGEVIIRKYDENDNLVSMEDAVHSVFYTYDYSDRCISSKEVHPQGIYTKHYRYDYLGNRIAVTDRYGSETLYKYDELNRLIETTYPAVMINNGLMHPTSKTAYDSWGNPTSIFDPSGAETKQTFNARGQPTKITHPDGSQEIIEYTLMGEVSRKIAPNGAITNYEYDSLGRQISEAISAHGIKLSSKKTVYKGFRQVQTMDATGLITDFAYDGAGRLTKIACGEKTTEFCYDSLGRQIKKIENGLRITHLEYDLLDRVTSERIEDDQGQLYSYVEYRYDAAGNRTHTIEQVSNGLCCNTTLYNADKKPLVITDAEGNETHFTYDHVSNPSGQNVLQITCTDPDGVVTVTTHDALERPINLEKRDPFGIPCYLQETRYDIKGNITETIDYVIQAGVITKEIVTRMSYDSRNQLTAIFEAFGLLEQKVTRYSYSRGEREAIYKPDGLVIREQYDSLGRLCLQSSSDGTLNTRYQYNLRHQPTCVKEVDQETHLTYDKHGRIIKETLAHGQALEYDYDPFDRIYKVMLPDNSSIEYVYDTLYLRQVKRGDYTHSYDDYALSGQLISARSIFNDPLEYRYNTRKLPTLWHEPHWKANHIQFDKTAQLISYEIDTQILEYKYDALGHLISEPYHQYQCDSLDNRLTKDQNLQYYNGLHQLTSFDGIEYKYDPNGNLIEKEHHGIKSQYRYDALDRLIAFTQEGVTTTYTYDAFHRRLAKNNEHYLYLGQKEIGSLDTLRILGAGYGAEIGATLAIEIQHKMYAVSNDMKGNIVALYNEEGVAAQYDYTAFGESVGSSENQIDSPWRYNGKRYDAETGFYYFGRRYYDPEIGRWTTPDPAGYVDGHNLYIYLCHHPLMSLDLYGLSEKVESNEQKYYPLTNVDLHDDDHERQVDEVSPNVLTTPEEKKKKKGQDVWSDLAETVHLTLDYVCGMYNTHAEAHKSAQKFSEMVGNHTIYVANNRTTGFPPADVVRCFFELVFHMETKAVTDLHAHLQSTLAAHPGWRIQIHCHSEGAIVTRNALEKFGFDQGKNIEVVAYAPGAYIRDHLAARVVHVRSTRDFVPHLDVFGRMSCRHSTIVLKPHKDAPWFDHPFDSPTYNETKIAETRDFIQRYGT